MRTPYEKSLLYSSGKMLHIKHSRVVLSPSISVTWAPQKPPNALTFGSPSHATAAQCAEEGGSRRNDGQILLKWTTPQGLCAFKEQYATTVHGSHRAWNPPCQLGGKLMVAKTDMCSQNESNARFWEHTAMARRRRRRVEL